MFVNEEARDDHLLRARGAAAEAKGVREPLGALQGARRSDAARDRQPSRIPRRGLRLRVQFARALAAHDLAPSQGAAGGRSDRGLPEAEDVLVLRSEEHTSELQ